MPDWVRHLSSLRLDFSSQPDPWDMALDEILSDPGGQCDLFSDPVIADQ
jgi:hypothetical protein